MGFNLGEAFVVLGLKKDKYENELKSAERKTEQSGNNMAGSFKKIGVAIAGVIAGLMAFKKAFEFLKESTELARTQERAFRRLEAQITATGKQAGWTANQLMAMAGELQSISNFGDEAIMEEAMSSMLKFGNVQGEVFRKAIEYTIDLAELTGSLSGAAETLGRALEDPERGISRLARSGITLSEEQEKMIKNFTDMNDLASAQGVILEQVGNTFGGVAKAMAEPTIQLANLWGDLKEEIGYGLVRATDNMAKALIPILEDMTELLWLMRTNLSDFVEQIEGMSLENLKEMEKSYRKQLVTMQESLSVGQALALWWEAITKFLNEHFLKVLKIIFINSNMLLRSWDIFAGLLNRIAGTNLPSVSQAIDKLAKAYVNEFLRPVLDTEDILDKLEALQGEIATRTEETGESSGSWRDNLRGVKTELSEIEREFNRIKRLQDGLHEFGLANIEEMERAWKVYLQGVADEYGENSDEYILQLHRMKQHLEGFLEDTEGAYDDTYSTVEETAEQRFNRIKALQDGLARFQLHNTETMTQAWDDYLEHVKEVYGEQSDEFKLAHAQMGEHLTNFGREADEFAKFFEELGNTIHLRFAEAITDSIFEAIEGARSFGEAFGQMARRVLMDIARMIVQMMVLKTLMGGLGGFGGLMGGLGGIFGFGSGGTVPKVQGHQSGGTVGGDPSKRYDSVLAWLTPLEEIINRDSADYGFNRRILKALNQDKHYFEKMFGRAVGFQQGGTVLGTATPLAPLMLNDTALLTEIRATNRILANIKMNPVIINKISPVDVHKAHNIGQRIRGGY